jgi:hypothetical protein
LTGARTAWLLLCCASCLDAPPSSSSPPSEPHSLQFFGSQYRDNGVDRAWIVAEGSPVGRIGARKFTVELWLKLDAEDLDPVGICPSVWFDGTILLDRGFFNGPQDGDIAMAVYRTADGSGVVATFGVIDAQRVSLCGDAKVADGRWHHVAFTRDDSDALSLWVDGVLDDMKDGPPGDGSFADTLVAPLEGDRYLVLGGPKYAEDSSYGFAGRIDDLRLSSDARYLDRFDPPYPPLEVDDSTLALYTFDEGQGTAIANAAGEEGAGELRVGGEPPAPMWSDDVPRP